MKFWRWCQSYYGFPRACCESWLQRLHACVASKQRQNTWSSSMSPGRFDMFLSRHHAKNHKSDVRVRLMCHKTQKMCVNCVQRSCENEPLINTPAICWTVYPYLMEMAFSRLFRSNNQSTINSVGSGNMLGHRPLMIILITASLSSET